MHLMCFYFVLIGILFRKADGVTGKLLYSNVGGENQHIRRILEIGVPYEHESK
jgi:hypothetical protein